MIKWTFLLLTTFLGFGCNSNDNYDIAISPNNVVYVIHKGNGTVFYYSKEEVKWYALPGLMKDGMVEFSPEYAKSLSPS